MGIITDQMLFRDGLMVCGTAVALLLAFLIGFVISGIKLRAKFDEEYGKTSKKKK